MAIRAKVLGSKGTAGERDTAHCLGEERTAWSTLTVVLLEEGTA